MAPVPVVHLPSAGWDPRILAFQVEKLVTVYAVVTARYSVLIDTLFNLSSVSSVLDALREHAEPERQLLVVNKTETVLDGGELHLVLVPTPGHDPDHLAVWIPELRTLFPAAFLRRR